MCISPITIKNPNYLGANHYRRTKFGRTFDTEKFRSLTDTTSQYIQVPCHHCPECQYLYQVYFSQRAQLLCLDHYCFFQTLTYSDDMIPFLDVGEFRHKYADQSDIQNYIKRIRNTDVFQGRSFKYVASSERGSTTHRPHWHLLYFVKKMDSDDDFTPLRLERDCWKVLLDYWCRNIGSKRRPDYIPLCRYCLKADGSHNYEFKYVTNSNYSDDVFYYVTKYVLKFDDYESRLESALRLNLDEDEYKGTWKVLKSRTLFSKGFGSVKEYKDKHGNVIESNSLYRDYVLKCLDRSSDLPAFFNIIDGKSVPMSRFLSRPLMNDHYLAKFAPKAYINEFRQIIEPDSRHSVQPSKDKVLTYSDKIEKSSRKNQRILSKHLDI